MITESTIYWITRLDNLRVLFGVCLFLAAVISGVLGVALCRTNNSMPYWDEEEKNRKTQDIYKYNTLLAYDLFLILALILILVFVPTTKEMCAIKVIPSVSNSEIVQKISAQSSQIVEDANKWMRDQVEK